MVLDRPEIRLNTNGSDNHIRCQLSERQISGASRSDAGRHGRDARLSLMKSSGKLGLCSWDDLGNRLAVPAAPSVRFLPDLIRQPAQPPRPPGLLPLLLRKTCHDVSPNPQLLEIPDGRYDDSVSSDRDLTARVGQHDARVPMDLPLFFSGKTDEAFKRVAEAGNIRSRRVGSDPRPHPIAARSGFFLINRHAWPHTVAQRRPAAMGGCGKRSARGGIACIV
jgi:hypothetical protein